MLGPFLLPQTPINAAQQQSCVCLLPAKKAPVSAPALALLVRFHSTATTGAPLVLAHVGCRRGAPGPRPPHGSVGVSAQPCMLCSVWCGGLAVWAAVPNCSPSLLVLTRALAVTSPPLLVMAPWLVATRSASSRLVPPLASLVSACHLPKLGTSEESHCRWLPLSRASSSSVYARICHEQEACTRVHVYYVFSWRSEQYCFAYAMRCARL